MDFGNLPMVGRLSVVCNPAGKCSHIRFHGLLSRVGFDIGHCTVAAVVTAGHRDCGIFLVLLSINIRHDWTHDATGKPVSL